MGGWVALEGRLPSVEPGVPAPADCDARLGGRDSEDARPIVTGAGEIGIGALGGGCEDANALFDAEADAEPLAALLLLAWCGCW